MRMVFGVLGLLVVVAIVGWLAKSQLSATRQAIPSLAVPGAQPAPAPAATVREQSQQIQQQIKQSVEATMQQARPMPEEK